MTMDIEIVDFKALSAITWHDIIKLRVDVFVVEQACAYPELDGLDPNCLHLIATSDSTLVATLRIVPPSLHDGYVGIGRVVVHPESRRKGIGMRIMKAAMDHAEVAFPEVEQELHAQVEQEDFYERLGFMRTGEDYDWDGIMHLPMRRVTFPDR